MKTEMTWRANIFPFIVLGSLLAGIPIFLLVYPMIFPEAPICAVRFALFFVLGFIIVISKDFVYRIGISENEVVFRKALRRIQIKRDDVVDVDIAPEYSQYDLDQPFMKSKNCSMTITLLDGRSLRFRFVELSILDKVREVLQPSIQ